MLLFAAVQPARRLLLHILLTRAWQELNGCQEWNVFILDDSYAVILCESRRVDHRHPRRSVTALHLSVDHRRACELRIVCVGLIALADLDNDRVLRRKRPLHQPLMVAIRAARHEGLKCNL